MELPLWRFEVEEYLLKNTLERFIDSNYLNKKPSDGDNNNIKTNNSDGNSRLVITAADIQKGEPVIFDNYKTNINIYSIVSCAGYLLRYKMEYQRRQISMGRKFTK